MRYAVFLVWPDQNEAELVALAVEEWAARSLAEHWKSAGFRTSVRNVPNIVDLKLPQFQFIALPGVELSLAEEGEE